MRLSFLFAFHRKDTFIFPLITVMEPILAHRKEDK